MEFFNLKQPHGANKYPQYTAAWGRCPAPLQFYMPVDGATFFAIHEHLSPSPLRVGVEGHPSYEECPLRQMHANPLPSVGSDGTFLACPPGSLVVSRGLIGGVALASTDTTIGGVLHWFALGHKHHLMDVALAESYGWVKLCSPYTSIMVTKMINDCSMDGLACTGISC